MTRLSPVSPAAGADVDALVIGAGPVGLYAAYYAGFRGLSAAVMDSMQAAGGQVSALYPEKLIYDVAGFAGVRGRDLVAALEQQAGQYDPVYALGEQAKDLEASGDRLVVTASSGLQIRARFIVITGGIGTFTPRRLPVLSQFEDRGVAYFVPRPDEYQGKDVVILGGSDSALDWAAMLAPIARSVTLVHRRDKIRAYPELVRKVLGIPVPVLTGSEVVAAHGDGLIEALDVLDKQSQEIRRLPAQAVVTALGFTADIGPVQAWGLQTTDRRIVVDTTMATSRDRVYAAGDIAAYPGKVRLISVGFGEAATAVNNAAAATDPDAGLFPGHSSDLPESLPATAKRGLAACLTS